MPREHIHFITGKLAADALRAQVERLAAAQQFDFSIGVLPITVAALMTCRWVARHWQIPPEATRSVGTYWKSGFRRIAKGADVPVVLSFLDQPTRTGGFGPSLTMTDDVVADMDQIRAFYADKHGMRPGRFTPPLLREESARGRTILMITHDLGHGLGLADRLAILYRGRIAREVSRAEISPAAVYDLYAEVTM